MSKVLVTGAGGFIGSHLVECLVRRGHEVRAFVNYNSRGLGGWLDFCHRDVDGNFEVFSGDIRDAWNVKTSMVGCDAVLHLAALIAIPYSYVAPKSYIETNIVGTLNVLQAARELDVSRVVHTSTSEVYGSAVYVPIDEGHRVLGQSPYSASKIGADQLAYSFFTSYQLPIVTLRPFNTFGPRQSMRAVIPSIIKQLLDGNSNLKLGSLKPTRNFNFVDDTVAGFVAALNSEGCEGETINIGSNYEVSIEDLAILLGKIAKIEVTISEDENRIRPDDSEVWRLAADSRKASQLLNWQPEYVGVDGFSVALERTFEWFSLASNRALYQSGNYNL